jgi:hypothetical protein
MCHLRNAPDLGGAYFTATMVGNQVMLWVSCLLYVWHFDGTNKHDPVLVLVAVGVSSAAWFASWGVFLLLINRKYLETFVSLETGRERVIRNFRDSEGNDEARCAIFDMNVRIWMPIREEVKLWVNSKYHEWDQERPSWFTNGLVAKIPDDMLPVRKLVAAEGEAQQKRSRAGVGKSLNLISGKLKSSSWRSRLQNMARRAERASSSFKGFESMKRLSTGSARLSITRLRNLRSTRIDQRDVRFDHIDFEAESQHIEDPALQ